VATFDREKLGIWSTGGFPDWRSTKIKFKSTDKEAINCCTSGFPDWRSTKISFLIFRQEFTIYKPRERQFPGAEPVSNKNKTSIENDKILELEMTRTQKCK